MTKEEFKTFCKDEFARRGFRKHKNAYYLKGPDGDLCCLFLTKSNYGPSYYVDCRYNIQSPDDTNLPPYHDTDMQIWGIRVMTKSEHDQSGNTFLSSMIDYEDFTADELKVFFDKDFEEHIMPVIHGGREYVKNNLDKFSLHVLRGERAKQKYSATKIGRILL